MLDGLKLFRQPQLPLPRGFRYAAMLFLFSDDFQYHLIHRLFIGSLFFFSFWNVVSWVLGARQCAMQKAKILCLSYLLDFTII
ncbi:hypothetical protein MA16_Dca007504 [Dendrobium catenatum]|uniref:Uncharacterized protein n=1 Tax=Dendrobium catenatum TaxID=906689 RepID=A0A2I0WBA3_9ASPA|nr:hypothetical protein MA16_Dca007504 [Dendrobium catenatum]